MTKILRKNTGDLLGELKLSPDFNTFYETNEAHMVSGDLSDYLEDLMREKGLKKSAVIRASELSEVYAYQIFSGLRTPERKKLLALAVGMGLTLDEVQKLLKCASYAPLYPKIPFDSVVIYGICKRMTVVEINRLLFEYCEETLG